MKRPFLLFGAYCALLLALSALSLAFGGNPHTPHSMSWDYLALGLAMATVVVCTLGIFGAVREVRNLEDLDVPLHAPLEDASSPRVLVGSRATGAA